MERDYPGRPPRLSNVFKQFDPPIYFITCCTFNRKPLLANAVFHQYFVNLMERKCHDGIVCGEYVIMPDHIHFFLRIDPNRYTVGKTVGFIKQSLSKPLRDLNVAQPHWQPGFFDHILRSANSYSEKWDYVSKNPVRAGLVKSADCWKYQGTVSVISY
jgi:putative transposase